MSAVSELNKSAIAEAKGAYFLTCNPGHLSNKDLLIMILEPILRGRPLSVAADDLLQKGLPYLASLSEYELSMLFGLNEKQSFHLMAVFELARRLGKIRPDEEIIIRSPNDASEVVSDLKFLDKEHFVCLFLNTKNRLIGRETTSIGTLNSALAHPREIFKAAIRRGAAYVIFAHNHPSMITDPSQEDIQLTSRLVEAGNILGIEVLDHLIIAGESYLSLKEQGHMVSGGDW